MKLSADRILTTHVGSLPRPISVVEILASREKGENIPPDTFDQAMRLAVMDAVERQVAAGVDVVSDGEMSKISYATYVKDRLTGFGGGILSGARISTKDYPEFREKMARITGPELFKRVACIGPISVKDRAALADDIARLKGALAAYRVESAFMNAASPGVVASFQPNRYYKTHEAYVEAIAAAMKDEYESIVAAELVLQVDCPDLAMSRHTAFQDLSEIAFLKRAEFHVEVLNAALDKVPADAVRLHICWGNYEGPHDHDVPLQKIINIILKAKPQAISFEASNPRHAHEWSVWRDAVLPDDKVLIPGLIDTSTNFVEHPELVAERLMRFAEIVGRERVIAGTDCGFGTSAGRGKLDPAIAYKKLRTLAEGAAIASTRLWR